MMKVAQYCSILGVFVAALSLFHVFPRMLTLLASFSNDSDSNRPVIESTPPAKTPARSQYSPGAAQAEIGSTLAALPSMARMKGRMLLKMELNDVDFTIGGERLASVAGNHYEKK